MERRYEAYVSTIVKPFFYGHFARLDRQIVLVDALTALNAGASAVNDLQHALTDILTCFRQGANSLLSSLFGRRIDRVLFAATKADQLHHTSHDRLEAILKRDRRRCHGARRVYGRRDRGRGARRHPRHARGQRQAEGRDARMHRGHTARGRDRWATTTFDGTAEAAIFPGDLPKDPEKALAGALEGSLRFVRFRPPLPKDGAWPHIRLDRAMEFLLGDRFQ